MSRTGRSFQKIHDEVQYQFSHCSGIAKIQYYHIGYEVPSSLRSIHEYNTNKIYADNTSNMINHESLVNIGVKQESNKKLLLLL